MLELQCVLKIEQKRQFPDFFDLVVVHDLHSKFIGFYVVIQHLHVHPYIALVAINRGFGLWRGDLLALFKQLLIDNLLKLKTIHLPTRHT